MHLKTTLIFFSICFFTSTKSKGLTATQLAHVKEMMHWYFINNRDVIQKVLKEFGIKEEYDYNPTDMNNVKTNKILLFLVDVDKIGDNQMVEKLNKVDVENIYAEFCKVHKDGNGLIDKEQFIELIDAIGYSGLIKNAETLDKNADESNNDILLDFKKDIKNDCHKDFNLADVLYKVLLHRTKLKKTEFGYNEDNIYWCNLFLKFNKQFNVKQIHDV
ncbi:uncharacterized protein LOC126905652 [Daktulosphaira vitifoliae]|uniref:uncharacterized protein LOC126905652 n=1 Tax=Daktulosphaira vitifoliae TaxID=58002 RepID=UPI0021AA2242|nr:uncharacterized protein LOC126905652 [Daktulosphaira vitifoliae]XP_050541540.1 uncharacterized protein LOC126905652 [Daktulosphaira vitifoliae]XP_050541541.1 uncharacterized protein LOC126905652 [Daktulosphaira vitifoliae]